MTKTKKQKSFLFVWFLCMGFGFILTGIFVLTSVTASSNPQKIPLLVSIDEIAVGQNMVFAGDNTFDRVYVFSEEGNFEFFFDLPHWGQKYIHFQDPYLIVNITAKDRDVLQYYDQGVLQYEESLDSGDEVEWHDSIFMTTSVQYDGNNYSFVDRTILPSIISVSGQDHFTFVVEPFYTHLVWNLAIVIWACCVVTGAIFLSREIWSKKDSHTLSNSHSDQE